MTESHEDFEIQYIPCVLVSVIYNLLSRQENFGYEYFLCNE